MILLIDNYDSFVYNIFQYLGILGHQTTVVRNDKINLDEIKKLNPDGIFLSPGPGYPSTAGVCLDIVKYFSDTYPILGVCLGHQSIAEGFGGVIKKAPSIMHGKNSLIHHNEKGIFKGLPSPLSVTRYHSLIVEKDKLPKSFEITAETDDGIIMGIKHKDFPVEGIQFHPESYRTEEGITFFKNFLHHNGLKGS